MTGPVIWILSSTEPCIKRGPNHLPSCPEQAASVEALWPSLSLPVSSLHFFIPISNIILLALSKALFCLPQTSRQGASKCEIPTSPLVYFLSASKSIVLT